MFYITGDTHGSFGHIFQFCKENKTTKEDVIIILGDAGFNYYGKKDIVKKVLADSQDITWFCVKGNHEKYPSDIPTYVEKDAFGGKVYVEEEFPNILFAKDGETYTFNIEGVDKKVLVIGGAYSVDKHIRLSRGYNWFEDEQPSEELKSYVERKIYNGEDTYDYILTHTSPYSKMPTEWFLKGIDSSKVDNTTEKWLEEKVYKKVKFKKWYCGHFHGNKTDGRFVFLFNEIHKLQ